MPKNPVRMPTVAGVLQDIRNSASVGSASVAALQRRATGLPLEPAYTYPWNMDKWGMNGLTSWAPAAQAGVFVWVQVQVTLPAGLTSCAFWPEVQWGLEPWSSDVFEVEFPPGLAPLPSPETLLPDGAERAEITLRSLQSRTTNCRVTAPGVDRSGMGLGNPFGGATHLGFEVRPDDITLPATADVWSVHYGPGISEVGGLTRVALCGAYANSTFNPTATVRARSAFLVPDGRA